MSRIPQFQRSPEEVQAIRDHHMDEYESALDRVDEPDEDALRYAAGVSAYCPAEFM